ncbi:hypothetical protein ACN47E_005627 [Coniothyrium glycines]
MPDSGPVSNLPFDPSRKPLRSQSGAPRTNHDEHSSRVAETSAPSTVTPATIPRQPGAFSVFSSLWGDNTTSAPKAQPILSDDTVPAIFTHAPVLDAQETGSDLTASTGSVPSTTTTLTNTLPPTQSAALRALNAPAFHSSPAKSKPAKSASSRTTVTSQPVVVRTYSGSRHTSRPGSGFNTPRSFAMNGHTSISALTAGLASRSDQLPSVDDFSFSAILRAVDPEIRDAIDAIAEICAKSRMSLADEYDAHLPPQGEITGGGPGWVASTGALTGRGRLHRVTQGWTAAENTLTAVPEASSSSEMLAQEGMTGSSRKRSQSAYGSLKSVISGSSGKRRAIDNDTFHEQDMASSLPASPQIPQGPAWTVHSSATSSSCPAITLLNAPSASKHLSLDTSNALDNVPEEEGTSQARLCTVAPRRVISRQHEASSISLPSPHMRVGPLRSISSWLPWPRSSDVITSTQQDVTKAESRLREMLLSSQNIAKSKAAVTVL